VDAPGGHIAPSSRSARDRRDRGALGSQPLSGAEREIARERDAIRVSDQSERSETGAGDHSGERVRCVRPLRRRDGGAAVEGAAARHDLRRCYERDRGPPDRCGTPPDILVLNAGATPPMGGRDQLSWADFTAPWEHDVKAGLGREQTTAPILLHVANQRLTAISTEPRCTQLTPSSAERARRERRHPKASTAKKSLALGVRGNIAWRPRAFTPESAIRNTSLSSSESGVSPLRVARQQCLATTTYGEALWRLPPGFARNDRGDVDSTFGCRCPPYPWCIRRAR
jgi:hypothetical protein